MYNYLKRLYLEGRLSVEGLEKAVAYTWVTTQEAGHIKAAKTLRDGAAEEETDTEE